MTERADELALLMTLEMGKPVAESKAEIVYAADFFRWFSGEALRIDGNYKQFANGTSRVLVMKQPVGPVPDDHALELPDGDGHAQGRPGDRGRLHERGQAGAADAAVACSRWRQILEEAGLPGGVFNIVTTSSSGKTTGPLIEDPRLRKLSFTGSTEVGRKLIEASAENVLKTSMELGGNAPFLIFEDADLDAARRRRAAGQDAQHRRGLHVGQPLPRGRADARGVRAPARREDGRAEDRPRHRGGREGRPADRPAVAREGGRAGAGRAGQGRRPAWWAARSPTARGYFFPPTVLDDVPDRARVSSTRRSSARWRRSRPSSPRRTRSPEPTTPSTAWWPTCSRATSSGRSGSARRSRPAWSASTRAWSRTPGAPFGGVKQSGIGREGGHEGLEEFLETKYVAVNL